MEVWKVGSLDRVSRGAASWESTPKLKCFLCDGPHLTKECPKRKALNTLIEKSEKKMEDAHLGSIQMIGAL